MGAAVRDDGRTAGAEAGCAPSIGGCLQDRGGHRRVVAAARRRSRSASARSWPRTPRGPTSRRPLSRRCSHGPPLVRRASLRACPRLAAADPAVGLLQRQGTAGRGIPQLPVGEELRRRVDAMATRSPSRAAATGSSPRTVIGPETADSIVLYAAGLPLFVVDAYTRRVFARLGLPEGRGGLRRGPAPLRVAPAARRGPLQRLPRPDRPPRQGRLSPAAPLRECPLCRGCPSAAASNSGPGERRVEPRAGALHGTLEESWGRHGFDGNDDPERSRPSVPTGSYNPVGKSQLPTTTWHWLPN